MSSSVNQASKDVAAALADIRGRRDQVAAEYDERLRQLEELASGLRDGSVDARTAQDKVRRLINERAGAGVGGRTVRAGRTKIGMRLPSEPTPSSTSINSMRAPLGPSPAVATAAVNRALTVLDARIVALLTEERSGGDGAEARLELALLRAVRGSLDRQIATMPSDVVLLGSVIEFAESVLETVGDLEEGGQKRVRRLLEYDRELVSQLVALGGSVAGVKEQLKKAQTLLGSDEAMLKSAVSEALLAFTRLVKELKKHLDDGPRSLMDDLLDR